MIEIDGSHGEGGGQILRTALSLSCLFGKPFKILDIRKGRKKPGLMPQHLTAVRAAGMISGAKISGDSLGSTELSFFPEKVRGGDFMFDIGTAGSVSLVFQTLLPALLFSGQNSTLILKGGTHVPFSPSFHYLSDVFAPALRKIGIGVKLDIESYGFYPKGGGRVRAGILTAKALNPLTLLERGPLIGLKGHSGVANLPLSIAERQLKAFTEKVFESAGAISFPMEIDIIDAPSFGQGTFIFAAAGCENCAAGFGALGERGKRAEAVGAEAAKEFMDYYSSGAALDPHLADQIVLYLSLASGEASFTTSCITSHLLTNLRTISLFHKFDYSVEGEEGVPGKVIVTGTPI